MVFVAAACGIQTLTPGTGGSRLFLFLIVQCFKVPFPSGFGVFLFFCFRIFSFRFGEIFGENKPSEDEYLDFYAGLRHKNGHHVSSR